MWWACTFQSLSRCRSSAKPRPKNVLDNYHFGKHWLQQHKWYTNRELKPTLRQTQRQLCHKSFNLLDTRRTRNNCAAGISWYHIWIEDIQILLPSRVHGIHVYRADTNYFGKLSFTSALFAILQPIDFTFKFLDTLPVKSILNEETTKLTIIRMPILAATPSFHLIPNSFSIN